MNTAVDLPGYLYRVLVGRIAIRLSEEEQRSLLRLITSSAQVETPQEFSAWVRGDVRTFFPHCMFTAYVGTACGGKVRIDRISETDCPRAYLKCNEATPSGLVAPLLSSWMQNQKPQLFDPNGWRLPLPPASLGTFHHFELQNIAAHGVLDLEGKRASYFSFYRIPHRLTSHDASLLELLTPHLHQALCRVVRTGGVKALSANRSLLARRETNVLLWIVQGKSNAEIADIVQRSEHTIRNQVKSILAKLHVNNRAQAAAEGVRLGLVTPMGRQR